MFSCTRWSQKALPLLTNFVLPTICTLLWLQQNATQSSGTAQRENRSDISQEAPMATERYGSRLNRLEMSALIRLENPSMLFLSEYY